MLIRIKRGVEANRLDITPKQGEFLFTTDEKKVYIGDGNTPGGVLVDVNQVLSVAGKTGDVVLLKSDVGLGNVANIDTTNPANITQDATHRFATDTEKAAINHTNRSALDLVSGTNTGDETNATIKTKLGAASSTTDGYITYTDWNTFNSVGNKVPYTGATKSVDLGAYTLDFGSSHSAVINKGLSAWSNKTILSTGYSASAGDYTKIGVASNGANTAGFYFTSAGRLGVNSDIPLAQFEVRGTGGNSFDTTGIFFVTEATDINRRLKMGYSISNECAWIDAVKAGTDMVPLALCPRGGTSRVVIGGYAPNANAVLDVQSTTKAFMPPRMTTAQRDAIPSPTAGMVVYNSSTNLLNFHNGTSWSAV